MLGFKLTYVSKMAPDLQRRFWMDYSKAVSIPSGGNWGDMCHELISPGQNGCHLAADILNCIFMNVMFCILILISLTFVPKSQIDNNSALVQVMAWRQIGDKPLSEPKLTQFTDAYMRH